MERCGVGFDFTAAIRAICVDMAARMPQLTHIDMPRVAVAMRRARRQQSHGVYATLTPLRFAGGQQYQTRRGRRYRVQPLVDAQGREFLYLLNFYLPRFMDLSLEQKLSTIVHELWHIGPAFDGDLRRHAGRCYAHGKSRRAYDEEMDRLAQQWLAADPPDHLFAFLAETCQDLQSEHGQLRGEHWPALQLVPA